MDADRKLPAQEREDNALGLAESYLITGDPMILCVFMPVAESRANDMDREYSHACESDAVERGLSSFRTRESLIWSTKARLASFTQL